MAKKVQANILVVDDDVDILTTARIVLKSKFSSIQTESSPHQISQLLDQDTFDLVLLDMNFTAGFTSGKEGLRWLKKIKKAAPQTHVVLMTAYGDVSLAVKAMKDGATDFVVKPWDNEALLASVLSAIQSPAPTLNAGKSNGKSDAVSSAAGDQPLMLGESPSMVKVFHNISKVASTDANVLVLGENGTGKELVARELHQQSNRADQAFVHVDMGAISDTLFESELFGHVKGAFTDAREDRIGRFEAAHGGTLFLDEIGNLSLPLQAKLLTALQSRTITRVGSNQSKTVDVRLICATNMPLHEMVHEKTFRQDLLYRINTVELKLPPLRDREGDIELITTHFLKIYTEKYNREGFSIPANVIRRLNQYTWPGNIRELQHSIERAVIMEDTDGIVPEGAEQVNLFQETEAGDELNLEEVEKKAIMHAINKHHGNISQAAKELGLGRTTLYRKMNKYGL